MSKYNKYSKLTVAILTALLIISIATPLLSYASAAGSPTVSLSTTSGPNGTAIAVTGTGFAASDTAGSFTILVDGATGHAYVANVAGKVSGFTSDNSLQSNASGYVTGYFVIYGLTVGQHTIQISDASAVPQLVTFTITAPTVSLSPSSGVVGTSVTVAGSGFPVSPTHGPTVINTISTASFPTGTSINIASGTVTSDTTYLSSNAVKADGTYAATVSLVSPVTSTSGSAFTMTDAWGNVATTTYGATSTGATVTLSPASGPVGTLVTATVTGFGPSATISSVKIGKTALSTASATVSEQGTAVFQFTAAQGAWSLTGFTPTATTTTFTGTAVGGTLSLGAITTVSGATTQSVTQTVSVTTSTAWTTAGSLMGTVANPTGFNGKIVFNGTVGSSDVGTTNSISVVVTITGSVDLTNGAHTVTVTDSSGNTASATFSVTPTATVTLGTGTPAVNSGVAYAPISTADVIAYLSASGFKANTQLTVSGSPGIPAAWTTFTATEITTDAAGSIAAPIKSSSAYSPSLIGTYSLTISDGTNTVTVILTMTASGNFFVITPTSGAQGSTVTLTGFLATPGSSGAINFDGTAISSATACAANTWPNQPTTKGSFTVPTSAAGSHVISTANIGGSTTFTTTGAPSITIVSPTTAAVGTKVTIVGTGFANSGTTTLQTFTIDGITVSATATFNAGQMIATFTVPTFLPGTHVISATDSSYNTASASITTTVASVSVSPSSGVVAGSSALSISITGSNFPMKQAISVTFDGTPLSAASVGCSQTNTNGGILLYVTDTSALTGANIAGGSHTITVSVGTAQASTTITVKPAVTVTTSTAVRPNSVVGISGYSFTASSALSIYLNGTATTWYNTATQANTTTIAANTLGQTPATAAVIIPASAVAQTLNITVVDAASLSASTTQLTILAQPTITLTASQAIAGATVGISGAGFSPGTRSVTAKLNSTGITLSLGSITVGTDGSFASTAGLTFTVPSVSAGTSTISLTAAASGSIPAEIGSATLIIMGAPSTVLNVTSAASGSVVGITLTGFKTISSATLTPGGPTSITLVSTTIPTTGANAYTLATSFTVPTTLFAGTYVLTVTDTSVSPTITAITTLTITPSISLSTSLGPKGTSVTISGTGFGPTGSTVTATFNGATGVISTSSTTVTSGTLSSITFTVPPTAVTNNTVTVTDSVGNTASAYYVASTPTLTLNPTSGNAGATIQISGSGFKSGDSIIVEVAGTVVSTFPSTTLTGPSFFTYITLPTTISGNVTISALDSDNNVGTATYSVTGNSNVIVNTSTLSSTAQTLNSAGTATTSFTSGSTVKVSFVLQSTTGTGNVVTAITFQQGAKVYNMASAPATISTSPSTVSFSNLLPAGATGTWTATLQVYASDGVTPLGVTTLTFTVS